MDEPQLSITSRSVPIDRNPWTGALLPPAAPIVAPPVGMCTQGTEPPTLQPSQKVTTETRSLKPLSDRTCKCGRHKIPVGANVCRKCNREAVQRYKARGIPVITEFEALVEMLHGFLLNNADTRRIYVHRHGEVATCTTRPSQNHPFQRVRVIVVAFKPGGYVEVQGESDERIRAVVHLDDLEKDDRKPEFRPEVLLPAPQQRDLRILHALLSGTPVAGPVIKSEAERRREARLRAAWTPIGTA